MPEGIEPQSPDDLSEVMELLFESGWTDGLPVVPPAELMPMARGLAEKICANGPLAVRVTKELAWRGLETPLEDALRLYTALGALVRGSEDAREGPRAFAEKRQPQFQGR